MLKSKLFGQSERLARCLVSDTAHVTVGDVGEHVRLIQVALVAIDSLAISDGEIAAMRYGESTAAAVLAYKKKRKIINQSYQSSEDRIVGKMTIAALDKDMFDMQHTPAPNGQPRCSRYTGFTIAYRRSPYPIA